MIATASGQPSAVRTYLEPAIYLRLGAGTSKGAVEQVRSIGGDLPLAQIGRQSPPVRTGLETCSRINRSIRCSPHGVPSATTSCHSSLAPYVRSLAKKPARTSAPTSSSLRLRRLLGRFSQPPRETPSAPHTNSQGRPPGALR